MPRTATRVSAADGAALSISLDRRAADSLCNQIVQQLRRLILSGRVRAGARLPSTRSLAVQLRVSRTTVVVAFDQLVAEGYVEGRPRSGLFASPALPDRTARVPGSRREPYVPEPLPLFKPPARPFELGVIDPALFPHREWARRLQACWRAPAPALLAAPDPMGWPALRTAIAQHLHTWRGITCNPAQVLITGGAFSAMSVIAGAAFRRGDTVLIENPTHFSIRHAITAAGLVPEPLAVDGDGFDPARARGRRDARGALLTPSRQFPLGATLPLARRLALLEWAEAIDGVIVEDDFDSEYRYAGAPLPALMSLDRTGSVLYVGTFSKVLSPSLRLGFLVVPERRLGAFIGTLRTLGPQASLVCQPVLADFIDSGSYATHIRRMRWLYSRRMASLQDAGVRLHGLLEFAPSSGGMHLVADLAPALRRRMSDTEASRRADRAGVTAPALARYYAGTPRRQGLLLGFTGFPETSIREGVDRLVDALR